MLLYIHCLSVPLHTKAQGRVAGREHLLLNHPNQKWMCGWIDRYDVPDKVVDCPVPDGRGEGDPVPGRQEERQEHREGPDYTPGTAPAQLDTETAVLYSNLLFFLFFPFSLKFIDKISFFIDALPKKMKQGVLCKMALKQIPQDTNQKFYFSR